MIKIVMAIVITSMPNWESVRYQGYVYPDMNSCLSSTEMIIENFKNYAKNRGDHEAIFDYKCFEIDSYPIKKFENLQLGI